MSADRGATEALVAFACESTPPRHALEVARRLAHDAISRAVRDAHEPPVEIAAATAASLGPPQSSAATVLGRAERLAPQWAAFVGGIAARATVVPAVCALAERTGRTGTALLEAIVIGTEADVRIVEAVSPQHTDRGWDPAGTIAPLGAALAAARLLALDPTRTRYALGIVATQAAGLWAAHGTMTQLFHLGRAAADAVEAALLAEAGFTGPAHPIEGRRGFAALLAQRFDAKQALRDLGSRYALDRASTRERAPDAPGVGELLARYALA